MPNSQIEILQDNTLHSGKWLELKSRNYTRHGKIHHYEMVTRKSTNGIVAVLPLTENNEVCFLSQFRIPLGQSVIELVAGLIDSGETEEVAANRELHEETGLTSNSLSKVGSFTTSAGLTNEIIHLYIAKNCIPTGTPHQAEAAEQITLHFIPRDKALTWLIEKAQTNLIDPKTFAGLNFL
jgi:ADP-ribose pyrophosphatase